MHQEAAEEIFEDVKTHILDHINDNGKTDEDGRKSMRVMSLIVKFRRDLPPHAQGFQVISSYVDMLLIEMQREGMVKLIRNEKRKSNLHSQFERCILTI